MRILLFVILALRQALAWGALPPSYNLVSQTDTYRPIRQYLNMAFDVAQNEPYFSQKHYWKNHEEVFRRIRHPDRSIRDDGGYEKWIKDEFLGERALVNLGLHTIGTGNDFRHLYERMKQNETPFPLFSSLFVHYAGHIGNEAYELSNPDVTSHDNFADLFFYDIAGNIIFLNDRIASFFFEKLYLRTWGDQPLYNPEDSHIMNAASDFTIRPNLFVSKLRPFFLFGLKVLGGISYEYSEKEFFTLAAGVTFTDPVNKKGRLSVATYYDREEQLSYALLINSVQNSRFKLNLYPGLWHFKKYRLGVTTGLDREDQWLLGLNLNMPLGLGSWF